MLQVALRTPKQLKYIPASDTALTADPGDPAASLSRVWASRGDLQRLIAALSTLSGIFFFAMILGFVIDAIREKMEMLKKGKSRVVEEAGDILQGVDPILELVGEQALDLLVELVLGP